MSAKTADSGQRRERKMGWWSGGWVVALAVLFSLTIIGTHARTILKGGKSMVIGDGKNPGTYGFSLTPSLVPPELIVASGLPKDSLRPLDFPHHLNMDDVNVINETGRGKLIVSSDRVIGVTMNGQACAYPLSILNWHEIVNDIIGGVPIAITYSPLTDGAAVFDRRVDGETLTFGVSGLLVNSNLVMYDRRDDPAAESLWPQLLGRAVCGPAAADRRELRVLPAQLMRWADWRDRHPGTLLLARLPEFETLYKRKPYLSYFNTGTLRFPVQPLPPDDGLPYMTSVVTVRADAAAASFPLPEVAQNAGSDGTWLTHVGDAPIRLIYHEHPPTVEVLCDDPAVQLGVTHAFHFAHYAMAHTALQS